MADQTGVYFSGIVSGMLLLCAGALLGLGLGFWQARQRPAAGVENRRVVEMLSRLVTWSHGMADQMSQYGTVVDGVSQLFRDLQEIPTDPDRKVTASILAEVVGANSQLQSRLNQAEAMLKQQAEELSVYMSEARTDPLTHLANRRAFDEELDKRLSERRRYKIELCVLAIDIDFFKRCNDTYGHAAGDAVLVGIAVVLLETVRQSDLVARVGGEELAVILPSTGPAEACRTAERIREAVNQAEFHHKNLTLGVTVSIGGAECHVAEEAGRVLSRADAALYAAKQAGRDRVYWHDGTHCVPVSEPDPETGATPALAIPTAPPSACEEPDQLFRQVCSNLRQRLDEVLGGTAG